MYLALQTLLKRLEDVLIRRLLRALGLEPAVRMHGEMVQMFKTEPENPLLVGSLFYLIFFWQMTHVI